MDLNQVVESVNISSQIMEREKVKSCVAKTDRPSLSDGTNGSR